MNFCTESHLLRDLLLNPLEYLEFMVLPWAVDVLFKSGV
jgi:hypothetical protein